MPAAVHLHGVGNALFIQYTSLLLSLCGCSVFIFITYQYAQGLAGHFVYRLHKI